MWNEFFKHVDIEPSNAHVLDGNAPDLVAECKRFEDLIAAAGGVHLFIGGTARRYRLLPAPGSRYSRYSITAVRFVQASGRTDTSRSTSPAPRSCRARASRRWPTTRSRPTSASSAMISAKCRARHSLSASGLSWMLKRFIIYIIFYSFIQSCILCKHPFPTSSSIFPSGVPVRFT